MVQGYFIAIIVLHCIGLIFTQTHPRVAGYQRSYSGTKFARQNIQYGASIPFFANHRNVTGNHFSPACSGFSAELKDTFLVITTLFYSELKAIIKIPKRTREQAVNYGWLRIEEAEWQWGFLIGGFLNCQYLGYC